VSNVTQPDLALLAFAREVQEKAYAPYSQFRVGAAVYTSDGSIFQGVNVENAAYSAVICAEAAALCAAVSAGHREITAVAIVGDSDAPTAPCGAARQVLAEFNPEMRVIMGGQSEKVRVTTLGELYPDAFLRGNLDQKAE